MEGNTHFVDPSNTKIRNMQRRHRNSNTYPCRHSQIKELIGRRSSRTIVHSNLNIHIYHKFPSDLRQIGFLSYSVLGLRSDLLGKSLEKVWRGDGESSGSVLDVVGSSDLGCVSDVSITSLLASDSDNSGVDGARDAVSLPEV